MKLSRQFVSVCVSVGAAMALLGFVSRADAGAPVKVRLGTLAPKGSSYTKRLQAMGEE